MSQYPEQYPQNPGGYPPNQGGYPPNTGGYPPNAGGYPPNQPGSFPSPVGGYPPQNPPPGGFPQAGGYPPNQTMSPSGFPPPTGGYPPQAGGYPPNQTTSPGGFPPPAGGYPPNQTTSPSGFPPPAGGYPPQAGGYPPNQTTSPGGFPPPAGGFPQSTGGPPIDKMQLDSEPGAPPLDQLVDLPGYEGITFDSSALKPPTYDESVSSPNTMNVDFKNAPSLSEEQAREALLSFVSQHCCYGSKAAKDMAIKDIRFNSAIHYKLETFGEKRETAWAFEPFKGTQTPVQAGGYAPGPWEVEVHNPAGNFHTYQESKEVPNTTNIRMCHKCVALGSVRCKHCMGRGGKQCTWCHGSGHRKRFEETERCTSCNASGFDRCNWCHGHGHVKCDVCKGHCNLRYFIKLTVTWTNHVEDHISDTADLPSELIRGVTGQTAFEDEQPRVWPISNFPDPGVNAASRRLVEKHKNEFTQERILMQRQQVRIVPIAKVEYSWKSKDGHFQVYGFENAVYFPDYPQSCCCGCSIL